MVAYAAAEGLECPGCWYVRCRCAELEAHAEEEDRAQAEASPPEGNQSRDDAEE
jgi:hypothetical protein